MVTNECCVKAVKQLTLQLLLTFVITFTLLVGALKCGMLYGDYRWEKRQESAVVGEEPTVELEETVVELEN
jgi:hypothetical protein